MPDIYEIRDKDGTVFEVQQDHPPTPEEARTAVAKYRVTSAKASGGPMMGPNPDAGPLSGLRQMYRQAFPPQKPRLDKAMANVGGVNINPEDVLMVGQAGRAVVGAAKAGGGVIGAAKEAAMQASPIVKYEAAKHVLKSMGVPDAVAIPAAMAASGYKHGAKAAEASPATTPEVVPPSARTPGAASTPSPSPAPAARPNSPAAKNVPRTLPPEDPAGMEIVDRMAGGSWQNKPSQGNGTLPAAQAPPPESILSERAVAERLATKAAPRSARQTFDLKSMTPAEQTQGAKWLAEGVQPDVIIKRIEAARKFTGTMKTATPDEAEREVARMARETAKRRKSGGPDEEP